MRWKNCGGEIEKGTGGLVGGLVGGESGHLEGAKVASGWGESGHWRGRKWPLEGAKVATGGGESGQQTGRGGESGIPHIFIGIV